jgi:hypothetical protein
MTTETPKGTIWATGTHHVYVNKEPASLYVPQYTILEQFKLMNKKINETGGIPIGIDHLDQTVLTDNPILKKVLEASNFNPYDVGRITKVSTDGDKIYATETEISNPLIQQLYDEGKLNDWSLIEQFTSADCPTGQADYVVEKYNDIERADLVGRGGCKVCEVGDTPDTLFLTAKLATTEETEDIIMTDTENIENTVEEVEESTEEVEEVEEVEESTEDIEDVEEVQEPKYITEERMIELLTAFKEDNSEQMEAKLATLKLEAQASDLVTKHIKDGKILPKQKDAAIDLIVADKEGFETFMASMPVIVELDTQKSKVKSMEARESSKLDEEDKFDDGTPITVEEIDKRM